MDRFRYCQIGRFLVLYNAYLLIPEALQIFSKLLLIPHSDGFPFNGKQRSIAVGGISLVN